VTALRLMLAALIALAAAPAASAAARVPYPFVGIAAGGSVFEPSVQLEREYDLMARSGAQSVRAVFHWGASQPYGSWDAVPDAERPRFRDEDGVPTDWSFIDRQVAAAARRRMTILPVVEIAPPWAARHPGQDNSPPRSADEFARFARASARRYGPGGSFWSEHQELPARPVREWQLWNEPSLTRYWSDRPWEADYVALVRTARAAVREVDGGARIVLAGFPNESWESLEAVYESGGRGAFDVVAVHPFTARVAGVATIVRLNRRVMRRRGDGRKPIMVTETSWSSTLGRGKPFANERSNPPWQTTERGQAVKVRRVFRLLARERRRLRIERVYWFTWISNDRHAGDAFDYSGLRRLTADGRLRTKPALRAYTSVARALRGCRRTSRGDRCGR
jgi:hypothetical protein